MGVHIKKWGNSASVRIPATVMAATKLKIDDPVTVREEEGRIVIEAAPRGEAALQSLLDAITEENRHDAADWGTPVGRELW